MIKNLHSQIVKPYFFNQDTVSLAKNLLGKNLVHILNGNPIMGEIVETEAYLFPTDTASHSYRGITMKNEVMFKTGGLLYVYFTYGMHYCFNITSTQTGEAVLIRAIKPVQGIEKMRELRGENVLEKNLTNGPAKAAQALGITKNLNGVSLLKSPLFLIENKTYSPTEITTTTRIGISTAQDLPLRFYVSNCPWVSRK